MTGNWKSYDLLRMRTETFVECVPYPTNAFVVV